MGYRRVLGGQPERVPADWVDHPSLSQSIEMGDCVADEVHAGMSEVQFATRVRELDQAVELLPILRGEFKHRRPLFLPLGLSLLDIKICFGKMRHPKNPGCREHSESNILFNVVKI